MGEFKRPNHLVIDAIPYLQNIMGDGLIKDLQNDEAICPVCHGTGLALSNNPYGLADDPDQSKMFPYEHQSVVSCRNCYNGVVKKCKYCGKLLNRHTYQCDCEGSRKAREQERIQKSNEEEKERISKAKIIEWNDPIAEQLVMLYSEYFSDNEGYFSDWDEFFDDWYDNHENIDDDRPKYVWSTKTTEISFDADSIIENACDDLCEEAEDQISNTDRKELQDLLNQWAAKQTGTTTYDVDYKYAIRIPWEQCERYSHNR